MFDVVVVGGGIVGCATALSCAKRGMRTLLLERGAIAGETSSAGMGHLMLQPQPDVLARLTFASVMLWKRWCAELGTFTLDECGVLWLAEDAAGLVVCDRIAADFASLRIASTRLDGAGVRLHEPALAADLAGGLHCDFDAIVVPMRAAAAFVAAARQHGAEVRHGTPVLAITPDSRGRVAAVTTPAGSIATAAVVIAAGVWTPEVAALAGIHGVPIRPRRGDLAVTAPGSCPIRMQLLEVGYLASAGKGDPRTADPGSLALNVQPQARGTCLIGATRQFSGIDRRVDRGLLARSLRRAVRFVPALADAPLVRTWAGLRPWSPDRLPLVGPVPGRPGLWLASGHEGLGLTLAPITGEIIAGALRGEAPASAAAALLPARFGLHAGRVEAES